MNNRLQYSWGHRIHIMRQIDDAEKKNGLKFQSLLKRYTGEQVRLVKDMRSRFKEQVIFYNRSNYSVMSRP